VYNGVRKSRHGGVGVVGGRGVGVYYGGEFVGEPGGLGGGGGEGYDKGGRDTGSRKALREGGCIREEKTQYRVDGVCLELGAVLVGGADCWVRKVTRDWWERRGGQAYTGDLVSAVVGGR